MKKKIVAICLCLALAAVAVVGATLAYFTDSKSATNTFTVGNVKIELLESSLHRENAGIANGATSDSPLWSNVEKKGTGNTSKYKAGDSFYTDEQIKEDAANYTCNEVQLMPGKSYHKMPYVLNTGKNDAYIRIRVMVPKDLDESILSGSMYTQTALDKKEFTLAVDDSGDVRVDGVPYNVYTFTRIDPLAPDEMTYWNVWGTVAMNASAETWMAEDLFGEEGFYPDGVFSVLVQADAIQAEGFANATEAFAAFDAQH